MKKLIWFTVLNTASMALLIASRLTSETEGFDWFIFISAILIVLTLIHFFVERNKLNQLK
ncbi:hypothetical protein [Psychroserpens mesophilus]|uniref:hypothetical protein n=1 Tax=Psychroserpens mesophilus TaxID=325473 RepID=UPI003D6503CB